MGVRLVKFPMKAEMYDFTLDHTLLENRDKIDQHPIAAITDLQETLDLIDEAIKALPNQFLDTKTIDLTHDVDNRTLKADVKISAFVDAKNRPNAIVEKDDGIYAPDYAGDLTALDQKIDNTYQRLDTEIKKLPDTFIDSQTIDFSQDVPNRTVTASVKIVTSDENALEIRKNGLFVDKYFDLDIEDTDTVHLYFEGRAETLEEMYNNGKVFSHARSSWSNVYNTTEANAWYFDSALGSFVQPNNTATFTGFVSTLKYRTYTHHVVCRSDDGDNDANGLVIAYAVDSSGHPHTLSVVINKGGESFVGSWTYAMVYDMYLPDEQVLFTHGNTGMGNATLPTTSGWSGGNYIVVEADKQGSIVSCAVSNWNSMTINTATTISIDLNDYSWGKQFIGKVQYGYCNLSQAKSYFTDITFGGKGALKAQVKISDAEGNNIEERHDGLFCTGGGGISDVSDDDGNIIEVREDGIYAKVPISEDEGNIITEHENGIYASATTVLAEDEPDNLTSIREDGNDRYVYTGISQDPKNMVEKGSDDKVYVNRQPIDDLRYDVNVLARARMYRNTDLNYYYSCGKDQEQECEFIDNSGTIDDIDITQYIQFDTRTNMEVDDTTHHIILQKNKRYSIRANVAIDRYDEAYLNDVIFKIIDDNGNQWGSTGYTSPTYTDSILECLIDLDTESACIGVYISNDEEGIIRLHPNFSWITVQEIGRVQVIDPVVQVDDETGIEDTPIGHMMMITSNQCPKHYLSCDGTEYNILDYPLLANHIKDQFGSFNYFGGDGIDTFCVPDYRQIFISDNNIVSPNNALGSMMYCIKYEHTYYLKVNKAGRHQRVIWDGEVGTSTADTATNTIYLDMPMSNYDTIGFEFKYSDGVKEVLQYQEFNIDSFNNLFKLIADDDPSEDTSPDDPENPSEPSEPVVLPPKVISLSWGYSYVNDFTNITQDSTYAHLVLKQRNSYLLKVIGIQWFNMDDDPGGEGEGAITEEELQRMIQETLGDLS